MKAPIIRYAFEQYAKGVPKKKIIDELNAKGVRNRKGKPLSSSSFQTALRNKKYIGKYIYDGQEMTGGCEALIDETTFQQVQKRLDAVRHAPAATKAKIDYLLQGKAFCGMCGAPIVGESGRGKLGVVYHYYACADRKKKHTCLKKNEKKAYLEWYIVEQTVEYVLVPARMEYIVSRLLEQYDIDFNLGKVRELERLIDKLDSDLNAAVDASLEAPAKARPRYYEKIELLETQKADLEYDLSGLKIASGIRYTKEQIMNWLGLFCKGDPLDPEFQQRIIDMFINSIYVYDDKLVIYYNIKGGEQVSYMEMLDSTEEPPFGDAMESCEKVRISHASACQSALSLCDRAFR